MNTRELRQVERLTVTGKIAELDEGYVRNVAVPWLVLIPVLFLAAVGRLPGLIFAMIRGTSTTGGGGRDFKTLRQGPGVVVTPVWVSEDGGQRKVEAEIHGYLRNNGLLVGDRVEVLLRRQRRPDLPPRAVRFHNGTTGQVVAPNPDTVLSHLGLPLLLQATIGAALLTLLVVSWFIGG